ncbi:hypothetical protein J7J26_00725 [Candidatus Micrarchaeota archaeon]|nr:hypothetical protein [Candidatus Micrarchaeota archaeon]
MNKYLSFFNRGVKIFYEYPQRVAINILSGLILIFLLSTVWAYFIGGDYVTYVRYFAMTELIIYSSWLIYHSSDEMKRLVLDGWHFIMLKPANMLTAISAFSIGKDFISVNISIITAIVLLLMTGFTTSLLTIVMFSLLFMLIIVYDSIVGYLLGGLAFFTYHIWGFQNFYDGIESLFGGGMAPLWIFPAWALGILSFFPFSYKVFYPVQFLLTGKTSYFITAVLGLTTWIVIFGIIGYIINRLGMKRFESQGG